MRYVILLSAQSEKGDPSSGAKEDLNSFVSSSETCFKIRCLGEDKAGTLDAIGDVLCAAITGRRIYKKAVESSSSSKLPSVAAKKTAVNGGQLRSGFGKDCDEGARLANASESNPENALSTAPESGSRNVKHATQGLWGLEFSYSKMEKVLGALEAAVPGLIFMVGAFVKCYAGTEASTLW